MSKKVKNFYLWLIGKNRCELCKGYLRRHGDLSYGGIDIKDTIGGRITRTAYVCNLCYKLDTK